MNDYVIVTDSTADLPHEVSEELEIKVIPMKYIMDDKVNLDLNVDTEEFYGFLREKKLSYTTQINTQEFVDFFSVYLDQGKDVLYIGFASALSGTYNNAILASEELSKKYPDRKIEVLDSKSASIGQGLLVYYAALKKNQGLDMNQLSEWVEQNKLKCCHWFMVDDLYHLKRGGRVSSTAAVVGSILSVKPILCLDNSGKLSICERVRGRRKAFDLIISKVRDVNPDIRSQTVIIAHGDSPEDAQYAVTKIKEEFGVSNIIVSRIGPVIGSHTGPGALAMVFMNDNR